MSFTPVHDIASAMSYSIRLSKENFKFSAAHFTIFGLGEGERLHGHNYYVGAEITLEKLQTDIGMAFDFNLIKPALARICKELDEYVLIAGASTYLTLHQLTADLSPALNQDLVANRRESPSADAQANADAGASSGSMPKAQPGEPTSLEIRFGKKRYRLPLEDVKVLPVCNITSEELAAWIGQNFLRALQSLIPNVVIDELALSVEETRGQCVIWRAPLESLKTGRKSDFNVLEFEGRSVK